jgi:Tfp pilus assembly protein PilF
LGLGAIECRDWPAALAQLEIATSHPQLHDIARLLRSVVLRQVGRVDEAEAELKLTHAIETHLARTYWGDVMTFYEQCRFGTAALLFDEAIRRDSADATALRFGSLFWATAPSPWADAAKALAWAKRGKVADPSKSLSQLVEGLALLELQQYHEAGEVLAAVVEHKEDQFKLCAQFGLAIVHARLGELNKANRYWHDAESVWTASTRAQFPTTMRMLVRTFEEIRRKARPVVP